MRQMNLRVADPRSFVIPANAGIQVVVFLGRALVGALSVYEINLWVVDPRQVPFLCTAKEKEPKERPPPSRRRATSARCPALLRKIECETNSPADERHIRSGSNTVSRIPPIFLPMLGL